MLKKINDLLAGLPMTIVAGVFLLIDLVPHLAEEFGGTPMQLSVLPFDPAWVTVLISGIPLLYLAIWRIIYNPGISKISSALLISIAMFAAIAIGDLFAAGEVAFIISKIPYLKRLSNATVKTIQFSISLSMCINFVAIILSLMEVLTPTTGALVHNAGSCFVVLIAALLYDRKFE